jgi:hypothetical protein
VERDMNADSSTPSPAEDARDLIWAFLARREAAGDGLDPRAATEWAVEATVVGYGLDERPTGEAKLRAAIEPEARRVAELVRRLTILGGAAR